MSIVLDARHSGVFGFGVFGEAIFGAPFDFEVETTLDTMTLTSEIVTETLDSEVLLEEINIEVEEP